MTTPSGFFGNCVDEHVGGGPPSSVSVGNGIFNGQSDSPRFIAKTVTSRQDYLIASPAMDRLGQSRAPLRSQSYIAASPHLTHKVSTFSLKEIKNNQSLQQNRSSPHSHAFFTPNVTCSQDIPASYQPLKSHHYRQVLTSSTKAQQAQHFNPSHLASPKPDKRKLQEKGQTKSTKRKIVSDRVVVLPPMIFQDGPSVNGQTNTVEPNAAGN